MQHAQKFGKDLAWCSGDILLDRQPGRQTQTHRQPHSSQYFATAVADEVKRIPETCQRSPGGAADFGGSVFEAATGERPHSALPAANLSLHVNFDHGTL